ncbi:sulfocyanin-like copper-binding protein [Caldivirga maquilingensis]|uniref:Sulfocyanin-like C-terminal domain-containing protein n=1 Tax=Caldivirga maquilingensis (strain ATCC 700844 / DSM 13496 / JCM 10307 / IC-167) TaxID=397948 RepID=A8MBL9_CALMQ|nr:sulfocyanin-like copper-binding protein [Caldivirga maquilingensis]ABW02752.1 hypothetical protein Cmaq_1935 [Caldivirga maquilingensis IC-167]
MFNPRPGVSRTVVYIILVAVVAVIVGLIPMLYLYMPHKSTAVTVSSSTSTTTVTTTTSTTTLTTSTTTVTSTSTTTSTVSLNPYVQFFQSTPVGPVTLSPSQVTQLESYMPPNVKVISSNNTIVFNSTTVYILVLAGPSSNYLSFQVFNLTNPTIVVPKGATVKITVLDVSVLPHSFGLVSKGPPYSASITPDQYPPPFPGSQMPQSILVNGLTPASSSSISGYVIEFNATTPGVYWYICFVPGHAASGMYGKFIVLG